MGPYKPLRTWVDDHSLLYGNNGSLDPIAHVPSREKTHLPAKEKVIDSNVTVTAAW